MQQRGRPCHATTCGGWVGPPTTHGVRTPPCYWQLLAAALLRLQASDSGILGIPLDIADTGFAVSNDTTFMRLDEWCE